MEERRTSLWVRMSTTTGLVSCALIGILSGALNVLAGGGSFITLPLLLFLGLPASIANGTNRVGVLAQNIGGVMGFHRHGVLDWRWAVLASVPAVAGAAIGAWGALVVPEFAFRRILAVSLLATTLWTLFARRNAIGATDRPSLGPLHPGMAAGFFVVGLYGGFLQAGVGFFILGMTTIAGMDLVRGNAIKVVTVMVLTVLSLAIFAGTGHVDWPLGIALGAGNFLGSLAGVRLAVLRGHRWLERVVTGAIVVFAIVLWFQS
jgi:uncharacterized membrane protein YfcA